MIHVLDAAAIIALLADEPAADEVLDLLGSHPSLVSAVNAAEVVDRLTRLGSLSSPVVTRALDDLVDCGLEVLPCDRAIATRAGSVRATHYDRRATPISLADCVALASAEASGGVLVTSDGPLLRVARSASVRTHPIVDSRGVRPV